MKRLIAVAAALMAAQGWGLELAEIFSDGAVIQRERPAVVWGWSEPGARVSVAQGGARAEAVADGGGAWRATLGSFAASAEGRTLTVRDDKGNRLERRDILVGEVWHASGQSNMEHPVWGDKDWYRAANGGLVSQLANRPRVRVYRAGGGWGKTPAARTRGRWRAFVADGGAMSGFSALATAFAAQLNESLGVPVGIIDTSRGGASIDAYIPADGWGTHPGLLSIYPKVKTMRGPDDVKAADLAQWKARGQEDNRWRQATALFNGVVAPLARYPVRGFLWYQGETNVGDALYTAKLHALYRSWSALNGGKGMPFYFAQLAPHERRRVYDASAAFLDNAQHGAEMTPEAAQETLCAFWEAQRAFAREETNAWMIVLNDIGDITDVHIRDKQSIGLRFAASALRHTYGFKIDADPAEAVRAERRADGVIVVRVRNAKKLFAYHPREIRTVEVAGTDGVFRRAAAKVAGATLEVVCKEVAAPWRVRYLHTPRAEGNIQNEVGLPLDAFDLRVRAAGDFGGIDWRETRTTVFAGGYVQRHFKVDGRDCWVVEPKRAADGKPWVWAMTFPTAFYERGPVARLLEKGYHYVYMETGNACGADGALAALEKFYQTLVAKGLARKAVVTGLSRGGLYAHRYAAAHPEQMAAVYADHPVCDLKSWPARVGDAALDDAARLANPNVRDAMRAYGFKTLDDLKAFDGNPVDDKILARLRAARMPILHVVAEEDKSVPAAENSDVFARKYRAIGGEITVVRKRADASVAKGAEVKGGDGVWRVNPAECGHHPHGLKDPTEVVAFIERAVAKSAIRVIEPECVHYIGPTAATTRRGEGDLARLADGGVLYVYAQTLENNRNDEARSALMCLRSADEGTTWGGERTLLTPTCDVLQYACPSLVRLQDGRLALFFIRNARTGGARAWQQYMTVSADEGRTWAEPWLAMPPGCGNQATSSHRVRQLANGDLIYVLYDGVTTRNQYVYKSGDCGRTWRRTHTFEITDAEFQAARRQIAEPAVTELSENNLAVVFRTGGGAQYAAFSRDNGETWTRPEFLKHNAARMSHFFDKFAGGRAMLVWAQPAVVTDPLWQRDPLTLAFLNDSLEIEESWTLDWSLNPDGKTHRYGVNRCLHTASVIPLGGGRYLAAYACGRRLPDSAGNEGSLIVRFRLPGA